jgi:hypothetical protein
VDEFDEAAGEVLDEPLPRGLRRARAVVIALLDDRQRAEVKARNAGRSRTRE